ncbi:MAG: aquaporin [Gammaproteobacteria bacterium]|nr:aquaporin [Gammaproteobacteria bacterium]
MANRELRAHWPEYLMEAWGLGTFMLMAGVCVTLLEAAGSPLREWLPNADARRALVGLAMGLTAVGIIYSPWGRRSGAHINPAVTLSFLRLGKIARTDALFYILAQFAGGTAGVLAAWALLGQRFAASPVSYVTTVPGPAGAGIAFAAEFAISAGLMLAVLWFLNHARLARFTGLAAGILVATYITVEAPLSGMSMNPARSFASALPGAHWTALWLYFTAPVLGMLAAVEVYRRCSSTRPMCAKLDHPDNKPCIHCGQKGRS